VGFVETALQAPRPGAVRGVVLPRRAAYHPSPADWRDEVIYFLLPDRFSDGQEATRPLLDPADRTSSRPVGFRWDRWAQSGGDRYQGGTIAGVASKLDYIRGLGATTLWIGPVLKQRAHLDTYHGYAIQDFLEVDPRLGTRQDLVDLVAAAHAKGLRVLLDVVINHTGDNWTYEGAQDQPPYLPWPRSYPRGSWRDGQGGLAATISGDDDGVWPSELQPAAYYTRAGEGDLGAGDIDDPHAEFRRTDFCGDRDINYDGTQALDDVSRCYRYWIALTDCDGMRVDTLKHVDEDTGRNFCGAIKEFAANLGKAQFFLVAEVAGADRFAERYLQVLGSNLDAALDIGEVRPVLTSVAKGLAPPHEYFDLVDAWESTLGSHRDSGKRHVSILDDHDHVAGEKLRFSAGASSDHQVVAGVAIQLFTLGIPCIYYGTEQAFAGPEQSEREKYLSNYGGDRYLREAMFGPVHPRRSGRAGIDSGGQALDPDLPGFGPFGTVGAHCFDTRSPAYIRIAALAEVRRRFPVLRYGRQYQRPISNFGGPFSPAGGGELIAWSRLLDDEEALCIVNGNGAAARGGDVLADAALNAGPQSFLEIVANSAHTAAGAAYRGPHPIGQRLPVRLRDGAAYVEIRDLPPSEVLVLVNHP
jgi:glycosidase